MSSNRRQRRLVTMLLLIVNVLLLSLALWEFDSIMTPKQALERGSAKVNEEIPGLPVFNFELDSIEKYTEIAARPLFNNNRRPEARESESGLEQQKVPLDLIGVVITPEKREGIFRKRTDNEIVRSESGDWIEGWKVESIEPDRIVMTSGSLTEEFILERKSRDTSVKKKKQRLHIRPVKERESEKNDVKRKESDN